MRKAPVLPTPRPHFAINRLRGNDIMRKNNSIQITQEHLRELLSYDASTGVFTRLTSRARKTVGSLHHTGYIAIKVHGKNYMAHRLAWLYVYGSFPAEEIDHINGNSTDNRISNLREASRKQNNENRALRSDSKSGFQGVSFNKSFGKFQSRIMHNKKSISLGLFSTAEQASQAYQAARAELFTHHRGDAKPYP